MEHIKIIPGVTTFTLILDSAPNPDFGQTKAPAPRQEVTVKTWPQASQVCRAYIEAHDLGGGNFTGGQLLVEGQTVAHVSYNGRVWAGQEWTEDTPCLYDPAFERVSSEEAKRQVEDLLVGIAPPERLDLSSQDNVAWLLTNLGWQVENPDIAPYIQQALHCLRYLVEGVDPTSRRNIFV